MVTKALTSLLNSANNYLRKAVEARENFYEGRKAEVARAVRQGLPGGASAAEVTYGNSLVGKTQIADNRWYMQQAQTFSLAATGEALALLLKEQQRTNELLEKILNQLNEMKVY